MWNVDEVRSLSPHGSGKLDVLGHPVSLCRDRHDPGARRDADHIAKAKGRDKDDAYKARLGEESTPALWDRYQAVQSRGA